MSAQSTQAASGIVFRGELAMPPRNTPQKTLESWKQIAAYLDRSERTVRRWEASEGLPVHRREHDKQDTVFAYKHEIEAWSRLRTKCPDAAVTEEAESKPPSKASGNTYLTEHDAITRTIDRYIAGVRAGDGDLMRFRDHFRLLPREWNTRTRFPVGERERAGAEYQSSFCEDRNY
jgi:hypothetical protein